MPFISFLGNSVTEYEEKEHMVNVPVETKRQQKFSSSGSDSQDQEKKKTAFINCLCLYQSYETEMLKCLTSGELSHSICYNIKTMEDFVCVTCTVHIKQGRYVKTKK